MKQLTNKSKTIIALLGIIISIGVITILTIGLNFELKCRETKNIQLYLEKDFSISDIKQITNEVFNDQEVIIQKVEVYEDMVSISTINITEEQKQNLINKINEKYNLNLEAENTEINTIPQLRGRDIIKPYIIPFIISTVIVLIYIVIRYQKLGIVKTLLKTIGIILLAQILLLSIIAIIRIPVGKLTMSISIFVYLICLLIITSKNEKILANKKTEKKEDN